MDQQITVSLEAILAATAVQRNDAHDRLAQMEAYVQQLTAERDQLAAEVEELRADAPTG